MNKDKQLEKVLTWNIRIYMLHKLDYKFAHELSYIIRRLKL